MGTLKTLDFHESQTADRVHYQKCFPKDVQCECEFLLQAD